MIQTLCFKSSYFTDWPSCTTVLFKHYIKLLSLLRKTCSILLHFAYYLLLHTTFNVLLKLKNIVSINSQREWQEYAAAITKGMDDGWLKPVIAREYSMDEIQLAHEHLMKRHGHLGKLVLKVLWLMLLLVNILWVVTNLLLVFTNKYYCMILWSIISKQILIPHTSKMLK